MDVKVLAVLRRAATDAALTRIHDHDAELASARTNAAIDAVADLMSEAQSVVDGTTGDLHYLRTALARCNGGAA